MEGFKRRYPTAVAEALSAPQVNNNKNNTAVAPKDNGKAGSSNTSSNSNNKDSASTPSALSRSPPTSPKLADSSDLRIEKDTELSDSSSLDASSPEDQMEEE